MKVVVDEPGGVLKIQAFGQDIRGHEHRYLLTGTQVTGVTVVVIRSEAANHFCAVLLRCSIKLFDSLYAYLLEVLGHNIGRCRQTQ